MTPACPHDGFHDIRSSYDRSHGVLRFFWICESCGVRLDEAHRSDYRPRFEPGGNDSQAAGAPPAH